jgi:C1A family cysteine protease
MEGAHFLSTGKLVKLSEQQCVDCVTQDQGCNGGWQEDCFYYAESDKMETEAQYPYTAMNGKCFDSYNGSVKVLKYTNVPRKSSAQLKAAIAQQPVAVTVNAGAYPFMHYIEGIVTDKSCDSYLDHAVLAVGYGVENGQEYYIVKNSWGANWGENGYIRIGVVDGDGICGIQLLSLYPSTD